MILQGQAILIPEFGKLPNLIDCDELAAFEVVSLAPFVNPFFRPEEKHGCSGEDEVIVPARESKWKVDNEFTVCNLAILYFQLNGFVTFCEYRVN